MCAGTHTYIYIHRSTYVGPKILFLFSFSIFSLFALLAIQNSGGFEIHYHDFCFQPPFPPFYFIYFFALTLFTLLCYSGVLFVIVHKYLTRN